MDKFEFHQKLAAILDIEEVKPEDVLGDFEQWNSLAVPSVLAMADSKNGVMIRADEIRSVVTAADLAKLGGDKAEVKGCGTMACSQLWQVKPRDADSAAVWLPA